MPENTPTEQEQQQRSDYESIADFLSNTDLMLNNAKSIPEITTSMTAAGYPVADVDAQLGQVAELRTLNEAQAAEYGDQFAATEAWHNARAAYHDKYIDHLGLARIAFRKDKAAKHELKLSEERKPSQGGYIEQALFFYDGAQQCCLQNGDGSKERHPGRPHSRKGSF
jgi:hypothetical protein